MFNKIYLEITNLCNRKCSFCPGHARKPKFMSENDFKTALLKVAPYTKTLFFHLMGEPLLHPLLPKFISLADKASLRPVLTTNGSLLKKRQDELLASPLYRINISLHSFEANDENEDNLLDTYLDECFEFAEKAAEKKIFCVLRLWNEGGRDKLNAQIESRADRFFAPSENERVKTEKGFRIKDRIFVEFGRKFEWQRDENDISSREKPFCLALRDQIGILCDGTVVPCCLDSNGNMALGNIFESELPDIISSPRATAIKNGFSRRCAVEDTCKKCGYRLIFEEKPY